MALSISSFPSVSDLTNTLTSLYRKLIEFLSNFDLFIILRAGFYIALGIIITLYACRLIGKLFEKHISAHHSQLLRRITFYVGLALSIVFPLKASGIDVTGLLGAAGIAAGIITAAVAFAAQTSISNFLSGVFLLAEKPFVIGDYVIVNDLLGEVLSIDLLSVKIRPKDNTFVRIPNEVLLKSQFRNVSRFPIRRFDIKLRFSFTEDLGKIKHILMEVAKNNPLCLVSPPPELSFIEFGDSASLLQFSVWAKQDSFSSLETSIQMEIQTAFTKQGIELPKVLPVHQTGLKIF